MQKLCKYCRYSGKDYYALQCSSTLWELSIFWDYRVKQVCSTIGIVCFASSCLFSLTFWIVKVSRRIPFAPWKAGSWKQTVIFVHDRTDGKHMWVDRLDFCDGLSILANSLEVKPLSPSLFLSSFTLHIHGRSGMTVFLLWAEQTKLWRWMYSGFKPPPRPSFYHYPLQQPKFSFCSDF